MAVGTEVLTRRWIECYSTSSCTGYRGSMRKRRGRSFQVLEIALPGDDVADETVSSRNQCATLKKEGTRWCHNVRLFVKLGSTKYQVSFSHYMRPEPLYSQTQIDRASLESQIQTFLAQANISNAPAQVHKQESQPSIYTYPYLPSNQKAAHAKASLRGVKATRRSCMGYHSRRRKSAKISTLGYRP
ncbi:hypothetical protein EJ03DRAFT_65822 [Teratosphaeria nubilosa]|uniref:Uncharacterized protein n=1 Tax=Teratosphaeria nubilosa TaxID=161662 RepID=A0A6G1LBL0_9PEZI|nr:hypothetical protein EJ03DRAFT_65822 [Teratosphaeria nubilosa]